MNRRAIWAIIVLMSCALLGIILIQSYWVNWSVQLNQDKFDKDVFEALNEVAERLRRREVANTLERFSHEQNGRGFSKSRLEDPFLRMTHIPLAERIDLPALDAYLRQELENRGLNLHYNYGLYSNETRAFVVLDNHFVFDENLPDVVHTGINKGLYNTLYKVELFKDADKLYAPGVLMIYFPSIATQVWGSVWQTLLGSFIFTGLILFCFAYTIHVILRQKKLSEMKTDFINNMTHEFKTPIATISLASDSITNAQVLSDPDRIRRFAGIIKQENKRMLNQVEKVLQMAVIDKQEMQLNITAVDLHEVIALAVENIALQVEHREGKIRSELRAGQPCVQGDTTHITNVIYNLLDNAVKYSPDRPDIVVRTRNVSRGIEIEVADKGIGMTREQLKYIFDRFYRVHTGNLHDVKGFGLGLSYVKAIVQAHKGQVDVKSEPGKGSSFRVFLPSVYSARTD